jgi:threonine/homoserine/homoserine lactone efflux protein
MFDPLPLATYSFVMSITPGPNNIMLTASGSRFGFWKTLPHLLGIMFGCALELVAACAGLGVIFSRWPMLQTVLQWVGAAYLVWLAWRLLANAEVREGQAAQPITFFEAAAFQFVNPKAWVMMLSTVALFLPPDQNVVIGSAYLLAMMIVVNLPCIAVWALFGSSLRGFLAERARRQAFNVVMAVALAATGLVMVT